MSASENCGELLLQPQQTSDNQNALIISAFFPSLPRVNRRRHQVDVIQRVWSPAVPPQRVVVVLGCRQKLRKRDSIIGGVSGRKASKRSRCRWTEVAGTSTLLCCSTMKDLSFESLCSSVRRRQSCYFTSPQTFPGVKGVPGRPHDRFDVQTAIWRFKVVPSSDLWMDPLNSL